jgi:hypothetical protein
MTINQSSTPEQYIVEIRKRYPDMTTAHQITEDGIVFGTSKRLIYKHDQSGNTLIGKFPFWYPRDYFLKSRLLSRVMRIDKCNFYKNSNGKMIGIRGGIVYSIDQDANLNPLFNIQGDCVLHRSIAEDKDGWSYFGEYFVNPQRRSVRIFKISPDLDHWEIAYEFQPRSIRHVHGIYRDPINKDSLWITVGDYAGECYIIHTDDRFNSVKYYGTGEQIWRTVNLFFSESYISWITDSHLEQNYACRMERSTGKIEIGQKFDCSNWYGCTTTEGHHIAFTTVESGPGIKRNESSIFISQDAFHWQEIYAFKKDIYRPYSFFKNGVISCPSGPLSMEKLFISGEGLSGFDGFTLELAIKSNG